MNTANKYIYLMPGLAASSKIFQNIKLPKEYKVICLDWIDPHKNESLENYAKRMSELITEPDFYLLGVSFGGILAQEIKKIKKPIKTIIVSSVKNNNEFPKRFHFFRKTKTYLLFPSRFTKSIIQLERFFNNKTFIGKRLKLYKMFLSKNDKNYLDWSIKNVLFWHRKTTDNEIIHIHGTADNVFPIENIKNAIPIEGGTHIMIIDRYKWFNENLPKILNDEFTKN